MWNIYEFNDLQMRIIQDGIQKNLDVNLYAKPEFDWMQMEQIELGLEAKIDASLYADTSYSPDLMKYIRFCITVNMPVILIQPIDENYNMKGSN